MPPKHSLVETPKLSLKHPLVETSAFVELQASIKGGDAEMELKFAIPFNPSKVFAQHPNSTQQFIMDTSMALAPEMKHSANWLCECGRPSTDLIHSPVSWVTPDAEGPPYHYPMMNLVGAVCVDGGVCRENWTINIKELASDVESSDTYKDMKRPWQAGPAPIYPPCASCYVCKKTPTEKLLKCSRCKLMRYCSADCQKQDWTRHKGVCKWVKSVKVNSHVRQ